MMNLYSKLGAVAGSLVLALPVQAGAKGAFVLKSPETQTKMIELYSSEGCSSCPPADKWLSTLRKDPQLWKSFVPVEFHVDYWNRLGWIDRYSTRQFTSRQYEHAKEWGSGHVYTPGFVLAGQEWERPDSMQLRREGPRVGVLEVRGLGQGRFALKFSPEKNLKGPFTARAALLGNGLESKIQAGENAGRTLKHDFVALSLEEASMSSAKDGAQTSELSLRRSSGVQPSSYSVVFWVERASTRQPVQVVGSDYIGQLAQATRP